MKQFKFRLERILHHRETIRREKRKALLEKTVLRNEEQLKIEMNEQALQENGLLEMRAGFILQEMYGQGLMLRLDESKERLIGIEEEVAAARAEYVEAAKDAEALQTLKRKQHEVYNAHVKKEEEKTIDEMVTQRFKGSGEELIE